MVYECVVEGAVYEGLEGKKERTEDLSKGVRAATVDEGMGFEALGCRELRAFKKRNRKGSRTDYQGCCLEKSWAEKTTERVWASSSVAAKK